MKVDHLNMLKIHCLVRMSHTAVAYENCDRSFKPVFADPKPQKDMKEPSYRTNSEFRESRNDNCPPREYTRNVLVL